MSDEFKNLLKPAASMNRAARAVSDEDMVRNVDVQAMFLEIRKSERALQERLDQETRLQSFRLIG